MWAASHLKANPTVRSVMPFPVEVELVDLRIAVARLSVMLLASAALETAALVDERLLSMV